MPTQRHRWILESVEEHVATIEVDGAATVRLPAWVLPRGARPGDVLAVEHDQGEDGRGSTLRIALDAEGREGAMRRSREQVAEAGQASDAGGDISL